VTGDAEREGAMGRLQGKIALITGAASGIGRGSALGLAVEGAKVAVADIDEREGLETCELIHKSGGSARYVKLDVTEEENWIAAFKEVEKEFGGLNVLVNNAGICIATSLFEMQLTTWRRQMAVNLDSMFLGLRHGIPRIAGAGGGSVINISSVAGLKGIAGLAGYCASKGGVRLLTKSVALECAQAKNGVRVNSIHPGAIETPIWVKMANQGEMPEQIDRRNSDIMEEARAASIAATPLAFPGLPSDIASGVVFLASDEARFITGAELVIDGGVMAG
jgi:NAD(P)-dependent dehydrogenase (short-subunit alcohol dehydrogenase family)